MSSLYDFQFAQLIIPYRFLRLFNGNIPDVCDFKAFFPLCILKDAFHN